MNLFIITLAIFLGMCFKSSNDKKNKLRDYDKANTTNAKEQYDIACSVVEDMANKYREKACKYSLEEYFINDWKDLQEIIKKQKEDKKLLLFPSWNEMNWLVVTATCCGISLDSNFMAKIYKDKVWNKLPTEISENTILDWKAMYPNAPKDIKRLKSMLKLSANLKKLIMTPETRETNRYVAYYTYTNSKILDEIALEYGLQTKKERNLTNDYPYYVYENITFLSNYYALRKIKEKKFMGLYFWNACENPTDEMKEHSYALLSEYESFKKKMKEEEKLKEELKNRQLK